jgi:hypothetical protein
MDGRADNQAGSAERTFRGGAQAMGNTRSNPDAATYQSSESHPALYTCSMVSSLKATSGKSNRKLNPYKSIYGSIVISTQKKRTYAYSRELQTSCNWFVRRGITIVEDLWKPEGAWQKFE